MDLLNIIDTFEDEARNRTFIVARADGTRERWVRCGQDGTWLVQGEPIPVTTLRADAWPGDPASEKRRVSLSLTIQTMA